MANRFLSTGFYKSPFVRSLKGSLKSLYGYIICDCSNCGIWVLDLEVAGIYIGFNVEYSEFENFFINTNKAIHLGNNKYFFPDFIEHQYPKGLQVKNPAHANVISDLKKLNLLDENLSVIIPNKEAPSKPLQSPIGNGNGNGYGNGNGEGNKEELEEEIKVDENAIIPKMQGVWYRTIPSYTKDLKNDGMALGEILRFMLREAGEPATVDSEKTKELILNTFQFLATEVSTDDFWRVKPLKSISNNIQEFYNRIKDRKNGQSKPNSKGAARVTTDAVKEAHARYYSGRK